MMKKVNTITLAVVAVLLMAALAVVQLFPVRTPVQDADTMLRAEELMIACTERIRAEKEALGIDLTPEDRFSTGLIGDPYSIITTTLGPIEAKRTAADSSMAALMVRMLGEAGIGEGDHVAAGFSGSFPGMNLAVLCACEAMGVDITYICSVGASTYGANQPEMTFPDMACLLYEEKLIKTAPAAFSLGGDKDIGADMDAESCEAISERLQEKGITFINEEDYALNLSLRRNIYEANGMPDCFVGAGGGIVTQGTGESVVGWGLTELGTVKQITGKSGLADIYNSEGLPVISLLNIKKLAADYDLPYDPEQDAAPGEGALYTEEKALWPVVPAAIIPAALLLWKDPFGRKRKDGDEK